MRQWWLSFGVFCAGMRLAQEAELQEPRAATGLALADDALLRAAGGL